MEKFWDLSDWVNKSVSKTTALGATRLNKMNRAINEADNRILALDTQKANKSDVLGCMSNVVYNSSTGIITFTWKNGNTFKIDLPVEKVPLSFSMSSDGVITMKTEDGTSWKCNIASLIPLYVFENSATIGVDVVKQQDGIIHVASFIKEGSIKDSMLENNYLASIIVQAETAQAAAMSAAESREAAAGSASAAALSAANAENFKKMMDDAIARNIPTFTYNPLNGHLEYTGGTINFFLDERKHLFWEVSL